jgi:hypothetical protein
VADLAPEIAHKDVIIAMLGASAGLAGLILVFVGLLVSGYQSYPADTPKKVKDSARDAIWPALGVFAFGIVSTFIGALWLAVPGGDIFYWACVVVFLADLLAIVAVAAKTTMDLVH